MKQVLASGVFDLLHPGHLYYLRQASKLGDRLQVLVARDENISRNLLFNEDERKSLVSALNMVDDAFLGYTPADEQRVIREKKPQVIALGYDQGSSKVQRAIDDLGLEIKIVRISDYRAEQYSASKFKQRLETEFD